MFYQPFLFWLLRVFWMIQLILLWTAWVLLRWSSNDLRSPRLIISFWPQRRHRTPLVGISPSSSSSPKNILTWKTPILLLRHSTGQNAALRCDTRFHNVWRLTRPVTIMQDILTLHWQETFDLSYETDQNININLGIIFLNRQSSL